MENKINIAEILRDKPKGTKLYDLLRNRVVELDSISTTDGETCVFCIIHDSAVKTTHCVYSEFGTCRGYNDGLQILFPSKEVRSWKKFAWKKGDVLVSNDGKKETVFVEFTDATYTSFKCKHSLAVNCHEDIEYSTNEDCLDTQDYNIEDKDAAENYIKIIERKPGGKLDMETLEIERQIGFEDGDIVFIKKKDGEKIVIVFSVYDRMQIPTFVALNLCDNTLYLSFKTCVDVKDVEVIRPATDEEKHQLFSALEKEGKCWNAETKMVEDIEPSHTFKPFDKVLVRDEDTDKWKPAFVSRMINPEESYGYTCVVMDSSFIYKQCIPYEGNEHLAFTNKSI